MNVINQDTGSPATDAPQSEPQKPTEAPSQEPAAEPQTPAAPQEGQPGGGGDTPQSN